MGAPGLTSVRRTLLMWFDQARRDLPWRRTSDPYAIWISEVMLQQTQVATVIPYFERFLTTFPTLADLARADLHEVLTLWRGLGYYSRARNLHAAAQLVMTRFGGALPRSLEELRTLPGFGRYTAGAVASIAFGEETPAVDGNVARVLTRMHALEQAPRERERALWGHAAALARGPRPGTLNQALMELGALICKPDIPACPSCPVHRACAARARGLERALPGKKSKPKPPPKLVELAVSVFRRGESVLLARRAAKGLFGGLWELPCAPLPAAPASSQRDVLGTVERVLTHRRLRFIVLEMGARPPPEVPSVEYVATRWVSPGELRTIPISSAMQAVLAIALPGAAADPAHGIHMRTARPV